ncbi:MAG: DUF4922 domain-containing protein [Bacteroidota bacterium]
MLSQKIFASFNPPSLGGSLPDLSISLLEQQKKEWPQLADAYALFKSVKVRAVDCKDFLVQLQWNPKRIVSASAKVDETSVRERKCFLCFENLPREQKGVLYRHDFVILCNPAPIFLRHYTIAHLQHIPQKIKEFIGTLFTLAKDLSPQLTVFYNGPQCGASVPDHMHFQASPSGSIPVERDAEDAQRRLLKKKVGSVSFLTLRAYGRRVLLLESEDENELESCIVTLLVAMKNVASATEEPMVNILCSFQNKSWRVIIYPRRKHRPAEYFQKGESRVMISPAAVDLGGLIITPIEKDFHSVDAKLIEKIFEEVCVNEDTLERIISEGWH